METTLRDTTKFARWLGHCGKVRQDGINALCEFYEPLVKSMAQRYRQNGEVEELEQVARLALVEACNSFDPTRWKKQKDGLGKLFSQHAVWCLRHALSEYVRSMPNPVRLPSVLANRLPKMRRETVRLAHVLGREPTAEELVHVVKSCEYQNHVEAIERMRIFDDEAPVEIDTANSHFPSAMLTPEEIVIAKEDLKALRRQRRVE